MESSNWQSQLSTVRERTQYAFKKSLFCDVEFTVIDSVNGGKVTIPANKYMLAVSSPVFKAMFYGELTEKKDTIDLPDCTKEGLQELLRYVHSDEVNLTGNNVMEVLYIADKYIMPFLAIKCREYIKECLKPEDVFTVLPQVQKLSDKDLEEYCWKVIDNKTQLAMTSKPFLEISREMLSQFLARDSLNINELEVFQAVDRWAAKKIEEEGFENTGKSKRAVLGEDIIRLIRFPLMSKEEFAEVVLPCEILKKRGLNELFQNFSKLPVTNGSMFCKKSRGGKQLQWSRNRFGIIRCPVASHMWQYKDSKCDALSFTVNKAVFLMGVQVFGSKGSTYEIKLEILKSDQTISSLSSSYNASERVNGTYYGFTARLNESVSLKPNVLYTITAIIKGQDSYYGENGKEIIHEDGDLKITFKDSEWSTNGTSVEKGQFSRLLLQL